MNQGVSGVGMKTKLNSIDNIIRYFCKYHNALIVGTGALWLIGETDKEPRDWDVMIPSDEYTRASRLVPKGSVTNSFGGIKVKGKDRDIDIWCMGVIDFFGNLPNGFSRTGVNPDKNLIIRCSEFRCSEYEI